MSITAVKAVLEPTAITATGQQAIRGPGDVNIDVYRGYAQAILDGSSTTFSIYWIDGTQKLPYTPTFVKVFRSAVTGQTAWVTGTAYVVGDVRKDSSNTVGVCIQAGTAGSALTMSTTIGALTSDGVCTWQTLGTQDTAATTVYAVSASAISNTGFTATISGAGTVSQVITLGFVAYK